ncbi:hypothetical protein [Corynebacterium pseudodiphtheriticum]|uniref:hypothetical protein n=1 Tax=Corynebacterium pseudodiphtheriticum TaxID=37637 RepID=UPI002542BB7E|nr:hypothetical protein [Corynebacterium pseudodiphtheriticum]MDK4242070.1 hypothetical protein [Corynebacterium pseudodiphtheriticum]
MVIDPHVHGEGVWWHLAATGQCYVLDAELIVGAFPDVNVTAGNVEFDDFGAKMWVVTLRPRHVLPF